MEGSVQTDQALLEELRTLRARVAELEAREGSCKPSADNQQQRSSSAQETHAISLAAPASQGEHEVSTLTAIFETINDGLVVYDLKGNILRTNTAFLEMVGASPQTLPRLYTIEQRKQLFAMRDEKGHNLPLPHWPSMRILNGESLVQHNLANISLTTLHGQQIQASVSGAPLRNRQGQIIGAVAVYRDVTEHRKLERRNNEFLKSLLAMAEVLAQGTDQADSSELPVPRSSVNYVLQRLMKLARRILRALRISVILIEPETDLLQPISRVGGSGTEIQTWQSVLMDMHLNNYLTDPQDLTLLQNGQTISHDQTHLPDSPGLHSTFLIPMLIGSRLQGLLQLDYEDPHFVLPPNETALAEAVAKLAILVLEREHLIQERAEARANELALLTANRRMDEFFSMASHELRTPLTTINGNIQLAKRRVQTLPLPEQVPEELQSKLELIEDLLTRAERQVRIQNRLVGDLLDVSRIQINRLELSMRACDLFAIVSENVEDQRIAVPERRITLTSPSTQPIPIIADSDRISQVITNYLTNALKYSESDRPVDVTIEVQEGFARVAVKDQGPGLPPHELERLWQRFYRVPGVQVLSGSGIGLGLGLHICLSIIERHQGHVGVSSTPGQGSTFWFTLPLAKPA